MSIFKLRISIVRESESLGSLIQAQYVRIKDCTDDAEKERLKENLRTLQESEAERYKAPDRPIFNTELVVEPSLMPVVIALATQLLNIVRKQ